MTVQREWQHIDILLLNEEQKLAVIIENKVDSAEHSDQLRRYYEVVSQHHPGWRIVGLYLTPSGETPSDGSYLPVGYGLVCEVMDGLAGSQASVVNPDVKTLMTHYTEMLRRHVVGDSEIAKLCHQIYQKHKRALDLIYEHRPDPQGATRDLLVDLIRNTAGLTYKGRFRNTYMYFYPKEWDVPALHIGNDSHGFLRFVFHNYSDELVLFLETSW
jgi:hypothetical protein